MICFFGILGIMAILEKLDPNTLDHGLGNRRSNSAPYYTSSKTILHCQDHLRVKLYLFEKVLGPLRAIWGNWVKNRNHRQGNMINNSKSSTPHFSSKEVLLSWKGHARVQLCLI